MARRKKLKSQKGFLEKWQVRLTFVATILTLATLALTFRQQISDLFSSKGLPTEDEQVLAGILSDADGRTLADIIVMLTDYSLTDTTDVNGRYQFQVREVPREESVQLVFWHNGKMVDKGEANLGNTSNNLNLRMKP